MVAFALTDEQRALLDVVRGFVERRVVPAAASLDRRSDPADCFSWEIVEEASRHLGLRTLTLDPAFGGIGADSLTTAMMVEELAVGDLGIAVVFSHTSN